MNDFRWEDPPPIEGGRYSTKWSDVVARLRERPGEWALVADEAAHSMVSHLKRRFVGCEWTCRGIPGAPNNRVCIYGRWVGPKP